jgi:hypothetical protein
MSKDKQKPPPPPPPPPPPVRFIKDSSGGKVKPK